MSLPRRRQPMALALTAAMAVNGCVTHRWNTAPIKAAVDEERMRGRLVRLETENGVVVLEVERTVHPYVVGRVHTATGPVWVDLREAHEMALYSPLTDRAVALRPIPISALDSQPLAGREVQLRMKDGFLRLAVEQLSWPWVEGTVQEGNATVVVDMRRVTRIEVREPDAFRTAAKSVGLVAGLLFLICVVGCPNMFQGGDPWYPSREGSR